MEVKPTIDSRDEPEGGIWHVRLEADQDKRFRFVDKNGLPRDDYSGRVMWVGSRSDTRIPDGVRYHLPYQHNNELLDGFLPPHFQFPNVRSSGGYLLHLIMDRGSVTSGGYFEEFTPQA